MEGKKLAATVVLVVIIVIALVFVARKSGMIKTGPKPPQWVLEQPIERIDSETFEVTTKQLQEWTKLGEKDGLYKNPATGKFTMASPMECGSCGVKIPAPMPPADMMGAEENPDTRMKWQESVKCPKCGKSPFAMMAKQMPVKAK